MKLKCIREAKDARCEKVMQYTLGRIYEAKESLDPEGWEVLDDEGNKVYFFCLKHLFKIIRNEIIN